MIRIRVNLVGSRSSRRRKRRKHKKWNPVKHPGSLKELGYSTKEPAKLRHRALKKAVKKYGYRKTMQKLGFLAGAARIPPKSKQAVKSDIRWLEKHYG